MKPSGPGLLFAGRFLITVSISLLVMGLLAKDHKRLLSAIICQWNGQCGRNGQILRKVHFPKLNQKEIENLNRPIACIVPFRRPSYLSLVFLESWHSVGYKFLFLLCLLLLFFSDICKASSDNHFAFLHLFSMLLMTTSCRKLWTFIYSSSDTVYQI